MEYKSGYQQKNKSVLSLMEHEELFTRLNELKSVLDYQRTIIQPVVEQLHIAESHYEAANKNMITARKSMNDFIERYRGGRDVDSYVQMENARLRGVEVFVEDTLQRASLDLSEKRKTYDSMITDGMNVADEMYVIGRIVEERKTAEVKDRLAFKDPIVHTHTSSNN